ncbi:MAG: serine/threonine-protein phosphatase [Clostridiales bacterium]|nr:serine/threonine-protein phosphatase [Clostridiales bacterium]
MDQNLGYRVANLQGLGKRARQEDSFTIANAFDVMKIKSEGLLFAVFDGMGGMKDGKLASETAASNIRTFFQNMDRDSDIASQLCDAVYEASDAVCELIGGDGGSTAVVGIIYNESLYYSSVGDSFLYLKRGNSLYRLNAEHNVLHEEYLDCVRSGDLDPEYCRRVDEAAALTQFLGKIGMDDVDYFIRPMKLLDGDILLSCSDGVGGVLSENEIMTALSFKSERAMCQHIEQCILAHDLQYQDNYTALIVKCAY